MTNGKLLKDIAKSKRITLCDMARAAGITRQGLAKKIDNRSQFKVSEVAAIANLLGLTPAEQAEIFFAL